MKSFASHSIEETEKIAANWLNEVVANNIKSTSSDSKSNGATIAGLSGHLGAGKTAFVKAVAKALGIKEEVTSPTFVIMKIYELGNDKELTINNQWPWRKLIHMDAYRLEKAAELKALRFKELATDPHNLIMVEWPENVGLDNSVGHTQIKFEASVNGYRILFTRQ